MEESEKEERLRKVTQNAIKEISQIFDENKSSDLLESENTDEKKDIGTTYKTTFKDYAIASIFVVGVAALFAWSMYNEVKYNTEQKNFFLLFIVVLIVYFGFVAIKSLDFKPKSKSSVFKDIFFFDLPKSERSRVEAFLFSYLGIPILLGLLGLLLTLLLLLANNLFWVLAIYLIASGIQFIRYVKNPVIKILTVLLLSTVLYAGFNAREIFKVNFKVEFNDRVILP
jgi:sterol desaturase/sphingolipid hydroxylase (fatty acid hydroxylase superfamily)